MTPSLVVKVPGAIATSLRAPLAFSLGWWWWSAWAILQVDLLRPGLLGASWREFSRGYDEPVLSASGHLVPGRCRRSWQLASLLREAVTEGQISSKNGRDSNTCFWGAWAKSPRVFWRNLSLLETPR